MPTVVSLFTGVGGLDFGFEAAGFRTAVAVELDPVCRRTIDLNRGWPQPEEGDVLRVRPDAILSAGGLVRDDEADVLLAGPPCQPFSKSAYWADSAARRMGDPRAQTLDGFLRILRELRPRVFLLENVRGLAYAGKDEGLQHLLDGIRQVNSEAGTAYAPSWRVLNAADYGAPQIRERIFIVGARDGTRFEFPRATHGEGTPEDLAARGLVRYRTAWDALGDLPQDLDEPALKVRGRWGRLLPSIPEGGNYLWHTPEGGGQPLFGWRTRYWSFLLKLAKDRPSWTLQASPGTATGPFHWRSRRLSPLELCRLQTFPDDIRFDCELPQIRRLVGNAVPSLLAEVLAWEIRHQVLTDGARQQGLKLMPPDRGRAPRPERRRPVPREYHHLRGDHAPHPGEGHGPGVAGATGRSDTKAPRARAKNLGPHPDSGQGYARR